MRRHGPGYRAAPRRPYDPLPTPAPNAEDTTMGEVKTLAKRQAELQALMGTPEGRDRLEGIADGYRYDAGSARSARTSVISYIIDHETGLGLIRD